MTTIRRLLTNSDPAADSESAPLDARAQRELTSLIGESPVIAAPQRSETFGRRRPAIVTGVVAAFVVAVTAGVLQLQAPGTTPVGAAITAPATADSILDLVPTVWRVRDAEGESDDTWLMFGAPEAELLRPKGSVDFAMSTQEDQILTSLEGWSMSLGEKPSAPWLVATTHFERDGAGWVLYDSADRVTARLSKDGTPPTSEQYVTTPEPLTASARAALADSVNGPGVAPLATDSLVGRWSVQGFTVADGSVTFAANGTWQATSVCPGPLGDEGGAGSYRLLQSGALLINALPSGSPACVGTDDPPASATRAFSELALARSVSIDGDTLTLFDHDGTLIGHLLRAP